MEEKIKFIVKKELDAEVINIQKITEGYSHSMYEVKINKEPNNLIIRFSNNQEKNVNLAKEKYIIDLMAQKNIPVPKIYVFNNSKNNIPEEYMIQEKLPGIRLDLIWGSMTEEEKIQVTEEMGKLLSKIHSIKLENFGPIEEGGRIDSDVAFKFKPKGEPLAHSPYLRSEIKDYLIDLARLISYNHLPKEFFSIFMNFLCSKLEKIDHKDKPTLIHGDYMIGHLFVKKENLEYKIVGLIDFELAKSSAPSNDFIKLHRQGFFDNQKLKKALVKRYGELNEEAVKTFRIIRDISFAQVLFESGDKELATKIIKEKEEEMKKEILN